MSARIWFQKHTVPGRNPRLDDSYRRHARDAVRPDTTVDFFGLPAEVYGGRLPADYVRFGQLEIFFSWYFADQAVRAQEQGYAAYVIGTSQDPGLAAARGLVSIPVVGYGQVTFEFLRSQGLRFGVVGFIPALREALSANLHRYGCAENCVGFRYLDAGRPLMERGLATGDIHALVTAMSTAAAELREDGAQVVVPGEGIQNELLWDAGVRRLSGLPVVDADGLALATAQMHLDTLRRGMWSREAPGYLTDRAPSDEVRRLRSIFAPAVTHPEPPRGRTATS